MSLSKQQLEDITIRIRKDISLMGTTTKRKFELKQFEDWIEKFNDLDNDNIDNLIKDIYTQQFISLENACIDNYDYILITGLGNLKTNQARQDILKSINEGNTTYKEDTQSIISEYSKSKKANNTIVEIDIKLSIHEK